MTVRVHLTKETPGSAQPVHFNGSLPSRTGRATDIAARTKPAVGGPSCWHIMIQMVRRGVHRHPIDDPGPCEATAQ